MSVTEIRFGQNGKFSISTKTENRTSQKTFTEIIVKVKK